MIKNVIIPKRIGTYYLFAQRVIGFDIGDTHVHATQVLLSGNDVTIEKTFSEPITNGLAEADDEQIVRAIEEILKHVDSYQAIHTAISSSVVVFKELKLPFTQYNQIKMVVRFEVEPMLPFALNDAVVDFIVTKQIKEENSSLILVAAVQNKHIAHHLSLFAQAGVDPELVTIDFFALYELYSRIPSYMNHSGGVALIDLGLRSTRVGYVQDGRLRAIRSLPQGIQDLAQEIEKKFDISSIELIGQFVRFGVGKGQEKEYNQIAETVFTRFWKEIRLTIHSFVAQVGTQQEVSKVLLLGRGAEIKDIASFATQQLGIKAELFNTHALLEDPSIKSIANGIPRTHLVSLGTALPALSAPMFNLRRDGFASEQDKSILGKQLLVAAILVAAIMFGLLANYFMQSRKLTSAATEAEQEIVTTLKDEFKELRVTGDDEDEELDAEEMLGRAREIINKEQKLWFAFERTSFLKYLLELTERIDREATGFTIDRLRLDGDTMVVDAHVKDYESLALLEKDLKQSKLFAHVEDQDNLDFNMTIRLAQSR